MITVEEALAAAKERAKPQIEHIAGIIKDAITETWDGAGAVSINIPKKIKRGKGTYDVQRFMVDEACAAFGKASASGSRWDVSITVENDVFVVSLSPVFPVVNNHP